MISILIVSSDQLSARVVAMALSAPEVEIVSITPLECIIEQCSKRRVDLVVFLSLSPYFASMNIIDYMRRELHYRPKIYVISHSHSQATILTLLECGVDQYMTFPLNVAQLRKKVFNLIEQEQ